MGTLIFWGVMVLGVFLGILLISLSSMAQKGEQVYDCMLRGDKTGTGADNYSLPASETLLPAGRSEVRPQGDLSGSVAAS